MAKWKKTRRNNKQWSTKHCTEN